MSVTGPLTGRFEKGNAAMLLTYIPARQAAISLAGAFITAMLFVTAAVGPLSLV